MTRRRPRSATTLALMVALMACSGGAEPGVSGPSAGEVPGAGSVGTGAITTPGAPPTNAGEAVGGPLFVGLSIHVEGWENEDERAASFTRHTDALIALAEIAADHRAVVTFELSEVFMQAVTAWDSGVIAELEALGQATGIHADVGGRGTPSLASLTTQLRDLRDLATGIGVDASHVSGVCSRGPWVEAALAAGVRSTSGAVFYCATALDPVPAGWDISGCSTPAVCHQALPVDDLLRLHPYRADSSADFITPAETGLVIMIGESGASVPCAGETVTAGACVGSEDDLGVVAENLAYYLTHRDPGRVAALTMSWSIGTVPSEEFMEGFFSVFDAAIASGQARWASMAEIGAAVP